MKILILSYMCYGKAYANGLCAMEIAKALNMLGVETHICGLIPDKDYIDQYRSDRFHFVDTKRINRVGNGRISSIISPPIDMDYVNAYYNTAVDIIVKNGIDAIVSMYFPIENLIVGDRIKQEYPHIQYLIYELDSAIDGISSDSRLRFLYRNAVIRNMKKHYELADKIFVMKSHSISSAEVFFKKTPEKMTVVDLPMVKNLVEGSGSDMSHTVNCINFFYTGELNSSYRSPAELFGFINECKDYPEWTFHFYSRGDCEDLISEKSLTDNRIIQHGYVPVEQLEKALVEADVLLSIGNSKSNSLPSKIFKYISTGKFIIHFQSQDDDPCIEYLKRYPLAIIVKRGDSYSSVIDYITSKFQNRVDYDSILLLYKENLPSYSAEVICDSLLDNRVN